MLTKRSTDNGKKRGLMICIVMRWVTLPRIVWLISLHGYGHEPNA
jgi:hypothetical protein